jgi:hypothetical protein
LIYASIVVGLSTYIIVFHLNTLVHQTSSAYTPVRDKIISRMKNDSDEHWASKGKQFAAFQPKHERLRPSEWWILLFWLQSLFTSTRRLLLRNPEPASADTASSPAIVDIGDEGGAASRGAEQSTRVKAERCTTTAALGLSSDSDQLPAAAAQPREGWHRPFPISTGYLKKHNPGPRPSSADPPTHEEV